MAEIFPVLPDAAFVSALTDSTMTAPGGTGPLFDSAIFDVRAGGDASLTNSDRIITVPLSKIVITVDVPYGTEDIFMDADATPMTEIRIDFTVWGNSGGDQQEAQKRLEFARSRRQAVFSAYGLNMRGARVNARRRPYQPIEGVVCNSYGWSFFYERITSQ